MGQIEYERRPIMVEIRSRQAVFAAHLAAALAWCPPGVVLASDGAADSTHATCLALVAALDLDPATCATSAATAPTTVSAAATHVKTAPPPTPPVVKMPAPPQVLISAPVDRDHRIYFPQGSVTLVEEYRQHLDLLAGVLRTEALAGTCLKLVGHSDSQGSFQANYELSLERAQTVQKYLLERLHGANVRIQIDGKGEELPLPGIAPNDPLNRRVEIFAKRCT